MAKQRRSAAPGPLGDAPPFCPNCSSALSGLDSYCPACGTLLAGAEEE